MRKFLIAAFAVSGLALSSATFGADEKKGDKDKGVTGVLIDHKCGTADDGKPKKEADAAKHPASCVLKCAETGIGVTTGDKWIKFDDEGQKIAKEYLEKHAKDKKEDMPTKVHVEGKVSEDGKTMEVTAIHSQKEMKDKKKES